MTFISKEYCLALTPKLLPINQHILMATYMTDKHRKQFGGLLSKTIFIFAERVKAEDNLKGPSY